VPAPISNSVAHAGPADRRAAIWPWLVMPLVTLALFFALFKLRQTQDSIYSTDPPSSVSAPAESSDP
jgi:hypothetical protein